MRLLLFLGFALAAHGETPRFREHTVATGLKGGYQVLAVDLNSDGKPDLLALASGMNELVWFENPGWERHVIAGGLSRMINAAVDDIDGDGIPEIALAHEFANQARKSVGIVSILKHGGDPRKPWNVREIDRLTTSHRLRWADIGGSGRKVLINAPLTGADAVAPEYRDHVPLVYYRPEDWKRRTITEDNEGVMHGIFITDWDGDRREDVLTASFSGIHVHRHRNGKWTRTEISKGDTSPWPKSGSSDVAVGTLGKTRFIASIEPWHGNQVAVYRKRGKQWQRGVIDDSLVDGHTILATDLDNDGRDEIIAGFRGGSRSVYLYKADGEDGKWSRTILDDGGIAAAACTAADLNGDDRIDVACIGSATANLKWYENLGSQRSGMNRCFCWTDYSSRRAAFASIPAARAAGTQDATTTTRKKRKVITAKVDGSVGLTPTNMVVMTRVRPRDARNPIAIPAALRRSPWPTMSLKMLAGAAPSAIRTPISAVRCRTTVASTP